MTLSEAKSSELTVSLCSYCNKKVVDAMKCVKCNTLWHPSCWNTSKAKKSSTCQHVQEINLEESSTETTTELNSVEDPEKEYLRMQVRLQNELLDEVRSKNKILMINNELLLEKIKGLESENASMKNNKHQHPRQTSPVIKDKITPVVEFTERLLPTRTNTKSPSVTQTQPNSSKVANMRSQQPTQLSDNSNEIVNKHEKRNNKNETQNLVEEIPWTTVVNKKNKERRNKDNTLTNNVQKRISRPSTLCTGNIKSDAKIKGAIRRKWIYVGSISGSDVTEDDIKNFLSHLSGYEMVDIKKLPTKGMNSAFSVGIPNDELMVTLKDPNFWPAGVTLREFNFTNFFRKLPNSINIT